MTNHPEDILKELICKTKNTIDSCFPPRSLSNRALKRAEQPWITKEISKEEKMQTKLFRKFRSSNHQTDHKNYRTFRQKLSKKKKKSKKAYFRELIKDANAKNDFKKNLESYK